MTEDVGELAKKYYIEKGYGCAESILRAYRDLGLDVSDEALKESKTFKAGGGGEGLGTCGTLLGVIMAIEIKYDADDLIKEATKEITDFYKERYNNGIASCNIFTSAFRKHGTFDSKKRKNFCANAYIKPMARQGAKYVL